MASFEWTKSATEKLIAQYELYPCLWNVTLPVYRNQVMKADAWKTVSEEVGAEVSEVRRKIHNLRNQFSNEVRKMSQMKSGQSSGDMYSTKWPYFNALLFIKGGITMRKSTSNLEGPNHDSNYDEIETTEDRQVSGGFSGRRKAVKQKHQSGDNMLQKAFSVLNKEEDDFDIFGAFVATELRSLQSDYSQKKLKRIIQRAILDVSEEDFPCCTAPASRRSSTCSPDPQGNIVPVTYVARLVQVSEETLNHKT